MSKATVTVVATNKARAIVANKQLNITQKLFALFDLFGAGALCVAMARDAAESFGLNRTSAEIAFYRWQAARAV